MSWEGKCLKRIVIPIRLKLVLNNQGFMLFVLLLEIRIGLVKY